MNNKNNKKSRTLVNVIGVPLLIFLIWSGGIWIIALTSVIMILGSIEFVNLIKKHGGSPSLILLQIGLFFCVCISIYKYFYLMPNTGEFLFIESLFLKVCLIIIFVIFSMFVELFNKSKTSLLNIASLIFGFLWMGVLIHSLIDLRYICGKEIALATIVAIWTCDTFAFFFGSQFGKSKILPKISPNKTWVGTIVGFCGSMLLMISLYYWNFINVSFLDAATIGFITGCIGQFGDFSESLLKREVGIKDTSNFLRGHGGILDRFDSLSFSVPMIVAYFFLKQIF